MGIRHHCSRSSLTGLFLVTALLSTGFCPGIVVRAHAQGIPDQIPGPADANRINPDLLQPTPPQGPKVSVPKEILPSTKMPDGVDQIHLTLKKIEFDGVSAFGDAHLRPLYAPYIGADITLDRVYKIADALTQMYRDRGYFLSMAYVPDQKIKDGTIKIAVIEGHISDVEIQGGLPMGGALSTYISRVEAHKPVTSDEVESFLLRINDIPGYNFRAVLSPVADGAPGDTKLVLIASDAKGRGTVSFDNFGSRYLGPNELSLFYARSLIPMTTTSISVAASLPKDELRYATVEQSIMVAPDVRVKLGANATHSVPGYTLKKLDVITDSNDVSAVVEWQPVRQRDENVVFSFKLERRNTETNLLSTPFSRDNVRVVRAAMDYDGTDSIGGYNVGQIMISQGVSAFGASRRFDPNTSRPEAKPDFTKLEARLTHMQDLGHSLMMTLAGIGQWSSGPMYASEEFGYGGQAFGRAYDGSEITGDHGLAGSITLQYDGLDTGSFISVSPYVFYDIGKVWNDDAGQVAEASGASAGLGMRGKVMDQTTYNIGLAYPLTRDISVPIYGSGITGPRFFAQVNRNF